jgi:16S rRNA (uracil1498-N3)-methyltransferase
MLPRFYAPDLNPEQPHVMLRRDEAHHLTRVMRLRAGDEVAVFDGRGTECKAHVASADRDGVRLVLAERVEPLREPRVALTLVQSVLKGEAMDDVVRDCTMVGVRCIRPVISARTTVKATTLSKTVERWRRVALSAAKQSGRARLPEIVEPAEFAASLQSGHDRSAFILLEPSATVPDMVTIRRLVGEPTPIAATLIIGPEGGWIADERDAALAAGCRPLSLGPLTLRADAVPLAACAAVLAVWEN